MVGGKIVVVFDEYEMVMTKMQQDGPMPLAFLEELLERWKEEQEGSDDDVGGDSSREP